MDKPKTILVVDDDAEFLMYLSRTLSGDGYEVRQASSSKAAIAEIEKGEYSIVLADLRLPGASGLEVLRAARQKDPLSVGILITGHSSVDSALAAMREGVYDYLVKPCAPDALLASVRRASEHFGLRRALVQKTEQLEKLEQKLDDKSRMIQNVSHELKNPLSVVYGYAAFLLKQAEEEVPPEDLKKSLQSIHNNAERLGHLLEELIESTRLQSHKIELDRAPFPASDLCREAVEGNRFQAVRKEIELKLGATPAGALVLVDAKRAHQIINNLLSNALKFTPAGGAVELSAVADEGFVRFTIRDTGVGIAPADLPHLFERFYQSDTTRMNHGGLGLGLEICKGLVELHGGHIWAESVPGQGSSFHFTLPLSCSRRHKHDGCTPASSSRAH